MLKEISKRDVQRRLTDDSLFIFRTINTENSKAILRFEVYPIAKYGTPEEIMRAIDDPNNLLMEETGTDTDIAKFSLL